MEATGMADRPWWRRRRWRAAAAGWLLSPLLWVLTAAPANYAAMRGWLPGWLPTRAAYAPLRPLFLWEPFWGVYQPYSSWWHDLGVEHHQADREARGEGIVRTHWTPPKEAEP